MTDIEATLDRLRLGEQVSLIVKPVARPDERDDVDATVVKVEPPYLLDDGESLYTVSLRDEAFRVTADGLDLGELRSVVR
jgi:hypothetical protein